MKTCFESIWDVSADNWLRGEYVCAIFSVHTLLNQESARRRISRVCIECDSHIRRKQPLGDVLKKVFWRYFTSGKFDLFWTALAPVQNRPFWCYLEPSWEILTCSDVIPPPWEKLSWCYYTFPGNHPLWCYSTPVNFSSSEKIDMFGFLGKTHLFYIWFTFLIIIELFWKCNEFVMKRQGYSPSLENQNTFLHHFLRYFPFSPVKYWVVLVNWRWKGKGIV